MTEPHRIRLRGPWRVERAGGTTSDFTWPWQGPAAGVALIREFQWPGADGCHVELVVEGAEAACVAVLNDTPLGQLPADITALLQPRNQLRIDPGGAALREVRLEVREVAG